MKEQWTTIKEKYEAFEARERLLLVGAALAAIYLIWDFFFYLPTQKEKTLIEKQVETLEQEITKADAEFTVLSGLAKRDPMAMAKKEIEMLTLELEDLDRNLAELSHGLMPADKLSFMLHDVLKINGKLRLVDLKTLPAQAVILTSGEDQKGDDDKNDAENQNDSSQEDEIKLYKHGVDLVFKGGYKDALKYIYDLENIEWEFYWDRFSYFVEDYPDALVSIRVFTLSSDKGAFESE